MVNRYVGLVHDSEGLERREERTHRQLSSWDESSAITRIRIIECCIGRKRLPFRRRAGHSVEVQASSSGCVMNRWLACLIRNRLGIDVFGTNTRIERRRARWIIADRRFILSSLRVPSAFLTRQEYTLTVATQHSDGRSQDWLDDALQFTVVDERDTAGRRQIPH